MTDSLSISYTFDMGSHRHLAGLLAEWGSTMLSDTHSVETKLRRYLDEGMVVVDERQIRPRAKIT